MKYYYDTNATDGPMGRSTPDPPYEFSDINQRVLLATAILIISVVGTIGNSLVIIAVLLSKRLRTATNAFVVNLSMADLLTSLVIPFHSAGLLGQDGLPYGEWVCSVVFIVICSAVGCGICTLASVGLNRFILITRPLTTYPKMYTPKKIASWLVLAWMFPLFVFLLPLLLDVGAVGYNTQLRCCGPKSSHRHAHLYELIIAIALYPVPLGTIIISYVLIWRRLHHNGSSPKESENENGRNVASRSFASMDRRAHVSRPSRQYEITKNMFYIVCAFMICTTPYTICLFYDDIPPAYPYAAVILFMNSCINPLIYATKHRDFKTVFGCILRRQWDLIPEPSDTLKSLRRFSCLGTRMQ